LKEVLREESLPSLRRTRIGPFEWLR